jgi:hypothetical protein
MPTKRDLAVSSQRAEGPRGDFEHFPDFVGLKPTLRGFSKMSFQHHFNNVHHQFYPKFLQIIKVTIRDPYWIWRSSVMYNGFAKVLSAI